MRHTLALAFVCVCCRYAIPVWLTMLADLSTSCSSSFPSFLFPLPLRPLCLPLATIYLQFLLRCFSSPFSLLAAR